MQFWRFEIRNNKLSLTTAHQSRSVQVRCYSRDVVDRFAWKSCTFAIFCVRNLLLFAVWLRFRWHTNLVLVFVAAGDVSSRWVARLTWQAFGLTTPVMSAESHLKKWFFDQRSSCKSLSHVWVIERVQTVVRISSTESMSVCMRRFLQSV